MEHRETNINFDKITEESKELSSNKPNVETLNLMKNQIIVI